MQLSASWTKPFAAAYRARGYFLISLLFWVAYSVFPDPFGNVTPKLWYQDLISKAVGSFDKICYLIFLAGLIYAVVSDVIDYIWTNSLQPELRKGLDQTGKAVSDSFADLRAGVVGVTFESIKIWLRGGRGQREQIRSVAETSLVSYYGQHNEDPNSLTPFILNDMLDNWASPNCQTWENFSSVVIIRPSKIPNHFEWQEDRNYTLVCPSRTGDLPLLIEGSVQIDNAQVQEALDHMHFVIRFAGKTKVDFAQWWQGQRSNVAASGKFTHNADGISIAYDGVWLRYEAAAQCQISDFRSEISIHERSLISSNDRCYAMALRHPTKGVRASLSLEGLSDWIVKPAVATAELYTKGSQAVQIQQNHQYNSHAHTPGWTLPGLAVVIEWSPG